MTKEEYLKREKDINMKIDNLRGEYNDLRKAYIDSNMPFPRETKVNVISKNGEIQKGVVVDYYVNVLDEIKPVIMKMKKDGTKHPKAHLYYCWNDEIVPMGT